MTGRGPSWDDYFLGVARQVATRATCDRRHVGAVLVHENTILSTGYNGSIRGLPHCDDVGHQMEGAEAAAAVVERFKYLIPGDPSHGITQDLAVRGMQVALRHTLDHCVRTVHAEANALALAARHGVRVGEATLYCTHSPCWPCFKLLANAGMERIVFDQPYRDGLWLIEQARAAKIGLLGRDSTGALVRQDQTTGWEPL